MAEIRLLSTGPAIRKGPDGRKAPAPWADASSRAPIALDEQEIEPVCLERPAPPGPLDEQLLDRLALAVTTVVKRYGPGANVRSARTAMRRALRLLGSTTDLPVRVIAAPDLPAASGEDAAAVRGRHAGAGQPGAGGSGDVGRLPHLRLPAPGRIVTEAFVLLSGSAAGSKRTELLPAAEF
ncbi:hypothetical protein GCM10010412_067500 [Nonomuraea recticatena]|uniref:Uncharacterized protein n=1 Tax=Nonomuraea recticatena TaxID=46178 RepID=A0ABP6F397_9ACTN